MARVPRRELEGPNEVEPIRILIVDDQELIREGLTALLAGTPGFSVIGDGAGDGLEALEIIEHERPNVVVMDIAMPRMNGLEATREISRRFPQARVLILTITETEAQAAACLTAGAKGYLMKKTNHAELLDAIRQVARGYEYISRQLDAQGIARSVREGGSNDTILANLTPRERQVMQLIAEGQRNKEIAITLKVGLKTVETHRTNLMRKLDVHNAAEITALAHRVGIVS